MPGEKPDLNARQQRFVEEYLVDLNGTQAATRAGYSPRTANEQASRLLADVNIQAAVSAARAKQSKRTEITADRVLQEFARIGFSDIRTIFTPEGSLRPVSELTPDEAACLASVEVVTRTLPGREGEAAGVEYTHKIRLADKVAALTKIGQHLGMFIERSQQLGPDGKPVDPRQTFVLKVER